MRNEVIVIDLADPICTKTIRSRQNDKNGLKLTVHLKENGKIVVLNGYVVKYEAINQWGQFIRDDAKIVDAGKGIFEYTLSPEAVSTPAEWLAYFVIEKNHTERTSTPDIRIVLRRDVKEGNIHVENYISEFDKALEQVAGYRKEIDEANKRIQELTAAVTGQKYQLWKVTGDDGHSIPLDAKTDINNVIKTGGYRGNDLVNAPTGANWWYIQVYSHSDGAYSCMQVGYSLDNANQKSLYIRKKAGNIWTNWERQALSSEIVPKTGGTFTGEVAFSGGLKQATDTGWIQMSINTANASNVEGRQVTRAKRNGDQVSVIGSLKNIKEGQVVFNIPTALRPAQQITDVVIIAGPPYSICEFNIETGGNVRIYNITTDKIIHFSINYLV
ncbi:BppU family phage baseplate upper protein [Bacillus cereus]|uniref:BppU family phage baseplate upper protein n=1 Tax=Bacillus cereus TaxID=1396 RepID=UPI000BF4E71F|nr:BppU family phage baseplate upper protein [Bacillus cereus]PFI78317.1 hypothetical protein COI83_28145 [Bacillus cereus]